MKRLLHLLVNPATGQAQEAIALQAGRPDTRVTVVVGPRVPIPRLPEGVEAYQLEGPDSLPAIDHARLLALIFDADTVITW